MMGLLVWLLALGVFVAAYYVIEFAKYRCTADALEEEDRCMSGEDMTNGS